METLKIHLFGIFHLYRHPGQEIRLSPIGQTLFAFVLSMPDRVISREVITNLLWGERSEEQARSCLNTAIWRLRKVLEPNGFQRGEYLLCYPSGEIGFNWDSDHWLDVQEFESCANHILAVPPENLSADSADLLRQILSLYHGDFLDTCREDWALGERERLRMLYLRCLGHLLAYSKQRSDYEQALQCGQRILQIDPLREEIHRELMQIYNLSGRRPLAIRQYELCRAALQDELGIPPMPETRALHSQILADGALPNRAEIEQAMCGLASALNNLEETRKDIQSLYAMLQRLNQDA